MNNPVDDLEILIKQKIQLSVCPFFFDVEKAADNIQLNRIDTILIVG
jgi:hypothetical protein